MLPANPGALRSRGRSAWLVAGTAGFLNEKPDLTGIYDLTLLNEVLVEAGQPAFVAMWESTGGQARYDRRQAWFEAEQARFLDTLCRDLPASP